MIRAGSLLYALCVALILSILSSSLIMLVYNAQKERDNLILSEHLIQNTVSGMNYYLTTNFLPLNGETEIDLFHLKKDSVKIRDYSWGLYRVVVCQAHQRNRHYTSSCLIGDKPQRNLTALYLAEKNKPLALCGLTRIKGTCYLPLQGVKRAYIEGQNFVGTQLLDGTTKTSSSIIPELQIKSMKEETDKFHSNEDTIVDIMSLEANKKVSNSFSNKTLLLLSVRDIDLENFQLSGNIVIMSKGLVHVRSSSQLRDVLIVSKRITIDKNFTGNFQGFAQDSIGVNEDVTLNLPSALCLISDPKSGNLGKISVARRSKIYGGVICMNSANLSSPIVNISLAEGACVQGMVYTQGLVEHKGSIIGSLYCGGFMLRTASATYENHLLNAEINSLNLPDYFVGIFPVLETKRKAIIKMLL